MSADGWWRLRVYVRTAWLLYRADRPLVLVGTVILPRMLLQVVYWSFVGHLVGGPTGGRYAFVGATVVLMLYTLIADLCDVPVTDHSQETWYRIATSRAGTFRVCVVRAIPYAVESLACSLVAVTAVGGLLGYYATVVRLLAAVGIYAMLAVSIGLAGLLVAGVATAVSAEVLVANLVIYLVILASGAIVPASSVPLLGELGDALPMRHGLVALRAFLEHRPWTGAAGLELLTGLGWGIAAWVFYAAWARADRRTTGFMRAGR